MRKVHLEDVVVVNELPGCHEEREDCGGSWRPFWAVCINGEHMHSALAPLVTSGMDLSFPRLPASSLYPPDLGGVRNLYPFIS